MVLLIIVEKGCIGLEKSKNDAEMTAMSKLPKLEEE